MPPFIDLFEIDLGERPKRKIAYEMRMVSAETCPVCKEVLMGYGTEVTPYNCSCGTWLNTEQDPFNYEVWSGDELNAKRNNIR